MSCQTCDFCQTIEMRVIYKFKKKKKKKKINRFMVKKFETIILKFVNMDPFHIKVS